MRKEFIIPDNLADFILNNSTKFFTINPKDETFTFSSYYTPNSLTFLEFIQYQSSKSAPRLIFYEYEKVKNSKETDEYNALLKDWITSIFTTRAKLNKTTS